MVDFLWQILPNLLIGFPNQRPGGLLLSLLLWLIAGLLGLGAAILVGLARTSRHWFIRGLAYFYIQLIRGLPLLLLLLLVHQGIGRAGVFLNPLYSAVIALTLYASAYQAEVVRAGLLAVPSELTDSARSLGASYWRAFGAIRWRYAFPIMLPGLINESITLFKDSSVVLVLGISDLMTVARMSLGSDVHNASYWLPTYLLVGLLYALIAFGIAWLGRAWEQRSATRQVHHSLFR
jgi:His/Glu/Gln/Arg/opine family amino acid ABC transporter permease subunit